MFCPNCGKQTQDDAKFCENCGKNLLDLVSGQSEPAMEAQPEKQPELTSEQPAEILPEPQAEALPILQPEQASAITEPVIPEPVIPQPLVPVVPQPAPVPPPVPQAAPVIGQPVYQQPVAPQQVPPPVYQQPVVPQQPPIYQQRPPMYAPVPPQQQPPIYYQQQAAAQNQELTRPMSLGNYMLSYFLLAIPLVGFILLLVWSFGSDVNVNKKNWSRALLIYGLIGAVASIFMAISMASFIANNQDALRQIAEALQEAFKNIDITIK